MIVSTAFRYTLQPYAGPSSRHTCPNCHKRQSFTRYLDTFTGELMSEEYGRCNREIKCGYSMAPSREQSMKSGATSRMHHAASKNRHSLRPKLAGPSSNVPLSIPTAIYSSSLSHYQHNALALLLNSRFGGGVADELVKQFHLGTSSYWPGACVFWLLDEQGRARGGQVVLYDQNGHTIKSPYRHTTWVHTALTKSYKQCEISQPAWLRMYSERGQKSPCLFGLPQLNRASSWKPVAIVESAKTAMIATPYLPEFIWMATMGLSNLTEDRLRPLWGRRIVLFPDAGAFDKWASKAKDLQLLGFQVEVSDKLEKLATPDEGQEGLDLADVLLRDWPGYPPSWDSM